MELRFNTLTPDLHLYGLRLLKTCPTCEQGTISRVPPHIQVYRNRVRLLKHTFWQRFRKLFYYRKTEKVHEQISTTIIS